MIANLRCCLALSFFCGTVSAATLFVDPVVGDNMNDGLSEQSAVASVTTALQLAMDGDVINVAAGEYSVSSGESLPLRFTGNITIEGAGKRQTIFDGEGAAQIFRMTPQGAEPMKLASMSIVNGASAVGAGLYISAPGSFVLEDAYLEGNAGNIGGAVHAQINGDQDSQMTFINCTFVDNSASIGPGIHIQQNGTGEHDVLIESSDFRGHNRTAVTVSQNDGGSILTIRSSIIDASDQLAVQATNSQFSLINSTLVGTRVLVNGGPGMSVVNSILALDADSTSTGNSGLTVIRGTGGLVRDSIVFPLNVDQHTVEANVLDVDPRLTATQRLKGASPARDRGDDSVVSSGALDIDGQSRIAGTFSAVDGGGLVDLGADEIDVLFRSSVEAGEN